MVERHMETILIDQKDIASLAVQKHTEPLHRLSAEWGLLESQFQNKVFLVSGYDNDPCELHEIEDVKLFMEYFNRECPFWLYFAQLDEQGSNAWMIRCLCALGETSRDDEGEVVVSLDSDKYLGFTRSQLQHIYTTVKRSGASDEEAEEVLSEIATSIRSLLTVAN
jgi:hypothetical protein